MKFREVGILIVVITYCMSMIISEHLSDEKDEDIYPLQTSQIET